MTETQPALTPEQWAQRYIGDAVATDEAVSMGNGFDTVSFSGHQRHALAALCLYGQPFGFTQRDVAMLVDHAGYVLDHGWSTEHGLILTLAARIAALLPSPEHE